VARTAELSLKTAAALGVPRLHLHTAEVVDGKGGPTAIPRHRRDVGDGDPYAATHRQVEALDAFRRAFS
jgi:hydroxypyruvate isomerase